MQPAQTDKLDLQRIYSIKNSAEQLYKNQKLEEAKLKYLQALHQIVCQYHKVNNPEVADLFVKIGCNVSLINAK